MSKLLLNVIIFGLIGFFLVLTLRYFQNVEVDPYVISTVDKLMYIPDIDVISAARNYYSLYSIYVNRIKLIVNDIEKCLSRDENLHDNIKRCKSTDLYDNIGLIEIIIPSIDRVGKKLCQILSEKETVINKYVGNTNCTLLREKIHAFDFVKFWEDKNYITITSNLERSRELLISHLTLASN